MATMTAADLVARAKQVAPLVLASIAETIAAGEDFHFDDSTGPQDELAIDDRAGFAIGDSAGDAPWAVMSIALTKENVASDGALIRALVASKVHYDPPCYKLRDGEHVACLGAWNRAGSTREEALTSLLDALLASTTMTAQNYADLALRTARARQEQAARLALEPLGFPMRMQVTIVSGDDVAYVTHVDAEPKADLWCDITFENARSVAALARALYESAAMRLTKDDFISGLALLDAHADAAVDGALAELAALPRKDG